MEGNTIYALNPALESGDNHRLSKLAPAYPSANIEMDFSGLTTLPEVISRLLDMDREGLHLVGNDSYVYHSLRMAEVVLKLNWGDRMPFDLLTRSGNLRATVMQIIFNSGEDQW